MRSRLGVIPATTVAAALAAVAVLAADQHEEERSTLATAVEHGAKLSAPPIVVTARRFAVTRPLTEIVKRGAPIRTAPEVPRPFPNPPIRAASLQGSGRPDPVLQSMHLTPVPFLLGAPTVSFDGPGVFDSLLAGPHIGLPPDTNGDVGASHYVASTHTTFQIYDKSGTPLLPAPVATSLVFSALGGTGDSSGCELMDSGDPIVLYDHLADRWLIGQVAMPNGTEPVLQCIAISQTSDPTGAYFAYEFPYPDDNIAIGPHFGVWPDGYYMTVNELNAAAANPSASGGNHVFERDKMLVGDPGARALYFSSGRWAGGLPSDLDGPPAPPGTPNVFAFPDADEWGGTDSLVLFDFSVDWANPANSTFTQRTESPLAVASFDPTTPTPRNIVPQPAPGVALDAIQDRLMPRMQFRNFGNHQTLVTNHTVNVDPSGYQAGVRYYELRDNGSGFTIIEQATYAPDADHRWMGSAAMDAGGNLAVGFSVSSAVTFPSVRYAGRLAGDPGGGLTRGEQTLIAGSGVQTDISGRWGDASALSVDPVDGCSFWYAQEYYTDVDSPPGIGTCPGFFSQISSCWHTRVGKFTFSGPGYVCSAAPTGTLQGTVRDAWTRLPIRGALVTANGFAAATDDSGSYSIDNIAAGAYDVTGSKLGYTSATTAGVSVNAKSATTRDFDLVVGPDDAGGNGAGSDLIFADGFESGNFSAWSTVVGDVALIFADGFESGDLSRWSNFDVPPEITSFSPKSAPVGTLVDVVGEHLAPTSGAPQVTLNAQGGGTIDAPVSGFSPTALAFVIPTGTATGPITVTVAGQSAISAELLEIEPASDFSLTAAPGSAALIQGESVSYAVTLDSATGFVQLAALEVSGLPSGVTASFQPAQISTAQTSVLTLTAPAGQTPGSSTLTVSASATVDGIPLTDTANVVLNVEPVTTSFVGRTVVADTLQTPLAGVTVTFLGVDGSGNPTACAGATVSDAVGNFALTNLPAGCVGGQLIRFDGTTATSPPGDYAGVDLFYDLAPNQVTASPLLVHLPRIDNVERVCVDQGSSVDQTFTFQTIPDLSIIVYAGTTFSPPAPDQRGCGPAQFPLTAVQVPVDRLPEEMPASTTTVMPFIVVFQPANTEASEPVPVFFPNLLNTPPGTNIELSTLDPTQGVMVTYGTGTVSDDGRQMIPDFDPMNPGKRYGLVHFDWHGPVAPPPPTQPTCPPDTCCPAAGNPISIGSGLQVIQENDIMVNGQRPEISIQRTYRTLSVEPGPFGLGTSHNYGYRLNTNNPLGAAVINLVDPNGNRFSFTFDGVGSYTNEAIPGLRGAAMTVTASGNTNLRWKDGRVFHLAPSTALLGSVLDSITDPNGNTITLIRNPVRPAQIIEVIDPVGRKLLLAYDAADRITSIVDPIGRTVLYTYNALGTLETVTDPEGGVTRYDYEAADRLSQTTDPRGVVVSQNTYDTNGRVIRQVQADTGVITFDYTLLNPGIANSPVQETTVTDAVGNQTTYRFNPQGFLTDVTDALGQTRAFEREPGTNFLLAVSGTALCPSCGSSAAEGATFTYDGNGNLLSRSDALGNKTTFTYEPVLNKVASITDAVGGVTTLAYDSFGNLLTRTDPNGSITTFVYDQFGLLIEQIDPLGEHTTFTNDGSGNLVAVIDPLGNTTSLRYDGVGRRIESTDALGRRTTTTYDKLDRLVTVTDAQGNAINTTYDAVGNRLSVTDARGNAISFTYDPMKRLETRTDSLGHADTRTYDLNGNLTSFVDRRGQSSLFAYDPLNRLTTETYQDGSIVSRLYNAQGRLIQANDSSSGAFSFSYGAAGRLLSAAGPFGTVSYIRDGLGRVSQRQVVGEAPVDHTYDPAGNLLSATTPQAGVTYTYDARNQVMTAVRTNGVTSDYTYDPARRLLSLTHFSSTAVLDAQTYSYDAVGNRIAKTAEIAQPLTTQPEISTYDTLSNQLFQRREIIYTYDNNGNRLTEIKPDGTISYNWDARNRLESIETATALTVFHYDFAGNLIAKDTGLAGPTISQSQQFVLDELTNVIFERNSNGDRFSVLTGQSIDQHLAVVGSTGEAVFGLSDAINSTVLAVDDSGVPVGEFQYEPFGQTNSTGQTYPFQFTGRVPVTKDHYHYRARYYDSISGSFISEDPVDFNARDVNLYRYVFNDPVNLIDPSGLHFLTHPATRAPLPHRDLPGGGSIVDPSCDAWGNCSNDFDLVRCNIRCGLICAIPVCGGPQGLGIAILCSLGCDLICVSDLE